MRDRTQLLLVSSGNTRLKGVGVTEERIRELEQQIRELNAEIRSLRQELTATTEQTGRHAEKITQLEYQLAQLIELLGGSQ